MTDHRTQLYLTDQQYRWLQRQARDAGSIAAVVRRLIDAARDTDATENDPFIAYLLSEPVHAGACETSVESIDEDLYGPGAP